MKTFLISLLIVTTCCSVLALDVGALVTDAFAEDHSYFATGFDVELLDVVFSSETIDYSDITFYTILDDMLADVADGTLDVGLGAITKTKEREDVVNFSHNTFDSGLRIMTHNDVNTSAIVSKFFKSFFNAQFLFTIFIVILSLFLISVLVWVLEVFFTKQEMKFFNEDWKVGILEAVGWSSKNLLKKETYSPKHPVSNAMAFVLLILSIVLVGTLTAYIAAQMIILSNSSPTINNLNDLIGKRVGTVKGSTSHDFLLKEAGGAVVRTYDTLEEVFATFHDENRLDAVVYDFPILLYHVRQRETQDGLFDTIVVGPVYDRQSYGFMIDPAMPAIEEEINKGILDFVFTDGYFKLYDRYFSTESAQEQTVGLNVSWVSWLIMGLLVLLAIGLVVFVVKKVKNHPPEEDPFKEIDEELGHVDARMVSREDIFRMVGRVMQLNLLILKQGHIDAQREGRYYYLSGNDDELEKKTREFIDDTVKHIKENQNDRTRRK